MARFGFFFDSSHQSLFCRTVFDVTFEHLSRRIAVGYSFRRDLKSNLWMVIKFQNIVEIDVAKRKRIPDKRPSGTSSKGYDDGLVGVKSVRGRVGIKTVMTIGRSAQSPSNEEPRGINGVDGVFATRGRDGGGGHATRKRFAANRREILNVGVSEGKNRCKD